MRLRIYDANAVRLIEAVRSSRYLDVANQINAGGVNLNDHYIPHGHTVIHYVNNRAILGLLLDNGVRIDTVDNNGRTALYYAFRMHHLEITTMLIENGASAYFLDQHFQRAHAGFIQAVELRLATDGYDSIVATRQNLFREIERLGYAAVDVPEDGNSFFHALVDQLSYINLTFNYHQLRYIAIQHIGNHYRHYQNFINRIEVERMAGDGETVSYAFMQALSNALTMQIRIYYYNDDQIVDVSPNRAAINTLSLLYVVENEHYLSVRDVLNLESNIDQIQNIVPFSPNGPVAIANHSSLNPSTNILANIPANQHHGGVALVGEDTGCHCNVS